MANEPQIYRVRSPGPENTTQEKDSATKYSLTWDYLKNWAYPLILTGLGFALGGLFFYQVGVEAGKKQQIQNQQQLQEPYPHNNPLLKQSRLEAPETEPTTLRTIEDR